MRNNKGFTLIELLIVVAIIAILAAIAVPNFLEAQVRSKVSRVRADHRSIATAIETYFVDNNQYPAYAYNGVQGAASADEATRPGANLNRGATFRLRNVQSPAGSGRGLNSMTTPIAYITSYPSDPFADTRGLTFRYARDRAGWILGSFGPNANEGAGGDMGWNQSGGITAAGSSYNWGTTANPVPRQPTANSFETIYSSFVTQPSTNLLVWATYDPTNGTVSRGDVWRVKD